MVDTHLKEHGLAALAPRVRRDLDALDGAALVGREGQRDRFDDVRVLVRQRLHLLGVVEEPAIRGAAARKRRLLDLVRVLGLRDALAVALRSEVVDLNLVVVALGLERLDVVGSGDDLDEPFARVLGEVEPQCRKLGCVGGGRSVDVYEREPLVHGLDRDRVDAQADGAGVARAPAGLDHEVLALVHESLGQLVGSAGRRARNGVSGVGVEDREVPVSGPPSRRASISPSAGAVRVVASTAAESSSRSVQSRSAVEAAVRVSSRTSPAPAAGAHARLSAADAAPIAIRVLEPIVISNWSAPLPLCVPGSNRRATRCAHPSPARGPRSSDTPAASGARGEDVEQAVGVAGEERRADAADALELRPRSPGAAPRSSRSVESLATV